MKTLVAATVTKVLAAKDERRFMRIMSDSTTITRMATDQAVLDSPSGGFGITAYESVIVDLPAGKEIFAISSVTPNISIAPISIAQPGEAIQA